MNRCPKIEYGRLSSEIAWMGVNSRTLSAKKCAAAGARRSSACRSTAPTHGRRHDRCAATARDNPDTVVS